MKPLALKTLAGFLGRLTDPEFNAGEWVVDKNIQGHSVQMPFAALSKVATDFVHAAYEHDWLDGSFNWPEWASTTEATELQNSAHAVAKADLRQISQMLTLVIRRDKFVEGSLLTDFTTGLILRIVKRADELWREMNNGHAAPNKLSNQQAGSLGEMLALAKLTSSGIAAYMSPEGAPGHDLIVVINGEAKSIEVKTRQFLKSPQEITRWPVDLGAKGDADFFVFIELDLKSISPTFYLLSGDQVRQITTNFAKGQGNCYPAKVRKLAEKNDFSPLTSTAPGPSGDPDAQSRTMGISI